MSKGVNQRDGQAACNDVFHRIRNDHQNTLVCLLRILLEHFPDYLLLCLRCGKDQNCPDTLLEARLRLVHDLLDEYVGNDEEKLALRNRAIRVFPKGFTTQY